MGLYRAPSQVWKMEVSNSQLSLSRLGLAPNTVTPSKLGEPSLDPIPNANCLCSWFWTRKGLFPFLVSPSAQEELPCSF